LESFSERSILMQGDALNICRVFRIVMESVGNEGSGVFQSLDLSCYL